MALVAAAGAARPRKLRIGVVADAPLQPTWLVRALARVAAADFAEVVALSLGTGAGERLPWALAAYQRLDRLAFGADPAAPMPLAAALPQARRLGPGEAAALAGLDLDVVFAVGAADDAGLERLARYGVWRFRFGADGAAPAALAGFAEAARGEPLTASALEVRLPGAVPRLACRSWSRTFAHSVARNRAQFLPKTGEFAYRALRELHRSGAGWIERCSAAPAAPPSAPPGLLDLARIGARLLVRARVRALHIEQWFLAFRLGDASPPGVDANLAGFTRIVPPPDRDWADPFALARNGRHYVFFEELPYAAGKGHISMIEIDAQGRWSPPVRVLERDYHLSYPFLLEHEGALYMIPESARNRSIELYRCVDFPGNWRLERTLLQGVRGVDATLHRHRGRWWMFANLAAGEARSYDDELHLFHSETLLGDWQEHPRNPVRSDARCARPAGALFTVGGALYRPAQVCVPRYGAGLAIHRVQRLTAHDYAERQVQRILPAQSHGILGLHTLNRAGALTVVDAFARRARL